MPTLTIEEIGRLLKPIPLSPLLDNPLVSILTANYNYAHFIGEAIESAQAQTYMNWEMIVCDDGSTDNSCEVVEHYMQTDSRIRLIKKQNGGQVSATNAAYCECKGQIVCFLDADDRFLPAKVKTVVEAFRSHPNAGFAGDRMFRIDAVGHRYGIIPVAADPPSGWYGPSIIHSRESPYGLAFGPSISLRREISDLIYPVSEAFVSGPDAASMAVAPLMTPLVGIPAPLTEYRMHGKNQLNSCQDTSETSGRGKEIASILYEAWLEGWQAARDYLRTVDPALAKVFVPSFEGRRRHPIVAYAEARLKPSGSPLSAYRDLLRSRELHVLPPVLRWFWRFSILMPRPVFRYAFGRNRLKLLFWRVMKAQRRLFASWENVRPDA